MGRGGVVFTLQRELMSMSMMMFMSLAPSAQFGWTPLILACVSGHFRAVHALLDAGANKEVKSDVGCAGERRMESCEGN